MAKIISNEDILPKFEQEYYKRISSWLTREKIRFLINTRKFLLK